MSSGSRSCPTACPLSPSGRKGGQAVEGRSDAVAVNCHSAFHDRNSSEPPGRGARTPEPHQQRNPFALVAIAF